MRNAIPSPVLLDESSAWCYLSKVSYGLEKQPKDIQRLKERKRLLSKCKFCPDGEGVYKVKIKGIKPFYACTHCKWILNDTLSKQGEDYDKEVQRLEKQPSTPKDLLNLLYILPYCKKARSRKIETKKSRFLGYLSDYPKSNLFSSVFYEFLIFVALMFGLFFLNMAKVNLGFWGVIVYVFSSLLASFLCGVLILNTGVTKVPCKRTWKGYVAALTWLGDNFDRIDKIDGPNRLVKILIFTFAKIPLYVLDFLALIVVTITGAAVMVIVGPLHALFLFAPAYYIDSKRRNSK